MQIGVIGTRSARRSDTNSQRNDAFNLAADRVGSYNASNILPTRLSTLEVPHGYS